MRYFVVLAVLVAAAHALPATSLQESAPTPAKGSSFWKGTPMDSVVAELQAGCASDDAVACVKYRVLSVLDHVLRKDSYQVGRRFKSATARHSILAVSHFDCGLAAPAKVTESVSVVRNSYEDTNESSSTGRSEDGGDLVDAANHYLQRHDVKVQLPWGARVSVSPRALDQDKLDISLDFASHDSEEGESHEAEARHRKYRKSAAPFLGMGCMALVGHGCMRAGGMPGGPRPRPLPRSSSSRDRETQWRSGAVAPCRLPDYWRRLFRAAPVIQAAPAPRGTVPHYRGRG